MRFCPLWPVPCSTATDYKFEIGKGEVLQDGTDVAIIATGLMVNEAIEAGKALEAKGIHARVINMCTIKPLDEELVLARRQGLRQDRHRARSTPSSAAWARRSAPAWQRSAPCPSSASA